MESRSLVPKSDALSALRQRPTGGSTGQARFEKILITHQHKPLILKSSHFHRAAMNPPHTRPPHTQDSLQPPRPLLARATILLPPAAMRRTSSTFIRQHTTRRRSSAQHHHHRHRVLPLVSNFFLICCLCLPLLSHQLTARSPRVLRHRGFR